MIENVPDGSSQVVFAQRLVEKLPDADAQRRFTVDALVVTGDQNHRQFRALGEQENQNRSDPGSQTPQTGIAWGRPEDDAVTTQ